MAIKQLLFGSTNVGKFSEVQTVAARFEIQAFSVKDLCTDRGARLAGLKHPLSPPAEVTEDASTYLGNAELKARAFFAWAGLPVFADDAGLEVRALQGAPGLYSARYAGAPVSPQRNIDKLLRELRGTKDRAARFRSVLFAICGDGREITAEGVLKGTIAEAPTGSGGFGYDSVFIPEGADKTLAELKTVAPEQVKTHRILALENLFRAIRESVATKPS